MIYSTKHLEEAEYIQVTGNYYALRSEWFAMKTVVQHLALCVCLGNRRGDLMFTALSAAAAWGIARLDPYDLRPYCVSETHKRADFIRWNYGKRDPHARVMRGILVTGPIRTVCDLAKFDSPESLLVSINYCLRERLFTRRQFLAELERRPGMKKRKLLLRLMNYATPKCESPLETIAWIAIYRAALMLPQQQVDICDENQEWVARVDMYWKVRKEIIILELDGKSKYKDNDPQVLYDEKLREDELRRLGFKVIRAGWDDVISGKLAERLREQHIPIRRNFKRAFPK
jgi:hypothetical protein